MVHWDDLKADTIDLFQEFKKHKIGWIGVGIITFMIIIGLLAPYMAPGVPEDWTRGHRRWDPNPSHAPPVWVDWITRDDYARQDALQEWDQSTPRPLREESAEAEYETSVIFPDEGNTTFQVVDEEGNVFAEESINVAEREAVEYIDVTDFSVEPVEDDTYDFAPVTVDLSADIEHTGIFEPGGAEDLEFTLDRVDYMPDFEEGEIPEELKEIFISEIYYLQEGDLDEAVFREDEDGELWVNIDDEDEFRIDIPEERHEFELDRADYEDSISEGAVSPELRRALEEELGDPADPYESVLDRYEFNITDFGELEEGRIEEDHWLRENFTLEGYDLADEVYLVETEVDGEWRVIFQKTIVDRWRKEVTRVEEVQFRLEETDEKLYVYDFDAQLFEQRGEWWISIFGEPGYRIQVGDDVLDIYSIEDIGIYGKAFREIRLEMPPGEMLHEDYEDRWELEPGESAELDAQHEFRLDGRYVMYLGDQYETFELGAGEDVIMDDLWVDETDEELGYMAIGENVTNIGLEERVLQMRVEQVEEIEGQPDQYTTLETETWELAPGQAMDIEFQHVFDVEGTYTFVLGSQEVRLEAERDVEEDDEAEPAALEDESDNSIEGEEDLGLQSQGQGLTADIELVEETRRGNLEDILVSLDNRDPEPRTLFLQVKHSGMEDFEHIRRMEVGAGGVLWRYEHTFTYEMQADRVPREIFFEFNGHSDMYFRRTIAIERPDAEDLAAEGGLFGDQDGRLILESNRRGGRVGEFNERMTTYRRMGVRDNIITQARNYLRRKYGEGEYEDPSWEVVDPMKVIFGQAEADWLRNPEPLKGPYEITITIDAINLGGVNLGEYRSIREAMSEEGYSREDLADAALDDATVHIAGNVYGIFGTDRYRRDIFLGWVWGARYGLYAGGLVALASIAFSTSYGMTSAYYGGWVDELMSRLQEIMMGIPTLPILIILLEFWQRSINVFVLIYALLMWRGAARVIRARGLQVAQDTYIEAAESLGSGSGRIIFKHMIPDILPYAIAQAALIVPVVIMAEAGMHILGLGDPAIVSWGTILNEANQAQAVMNYQESWFWILFPGVGMILIGFGFISTGMAIERIVNPEMQHR